MGRVDIIFSLYWTPLISRRMPCYIGHRIFQLIVSLITQFIISVNVRRTGAWLEIAWRLIQLLKVRRGLALFTSPMSKVSRKGKPS